MSDPVSVPNEIPAIQVRQWLVEWEKIRWDDGNYQSRPHKEHFYLFTISASRLRALAGVHRRSATIGVQRSQDLNPQRYHDSARSNEINRFIQFGFPWSDLTPAQRRSDEYADLQKPGWLPTAIIVNIIPERSQRGSKTLNPTHAITVVDNANGTATIKLPEAEIDEESLPPLEVIDGQHRLLAFGNDEVDYDLPVVAFDGLDRSWQAYLFWTINIKPKKINASLAYDLYPLLRSEDWLDKFYGHSIYRETRAQELTEVLWFYRESPWVGRINMLGEPSRELGTKLPMVSQAAWIRSLTNTYVK